MRKSTLFIGLGVVVLVIIGSAVWLSLNRQSNLGTGTTGDTATNTQQTPNTTDLTSKSTAEVTMRDLSFSPARIKIKKGTTVTWTNNDTVNHNVIADEPSSSGGLPLTHATFGKGETFSHTFDTVGTFPYHCAPHSFMKGSVEVID